MHSQIIRGILVQTGYYNILLCDSCCLFHFFCRFLAPSSRYIDWFFLTVILPSLFFLFKFSDTIVSFNALVIFFFHNGSIENVFCATRTCLLCNILFEIM